MCAITGRNIAAIELNLIPQTGGWQIGPLVKTHRLDHFVSKQPRRSIRGCPKMPSYFASKFAFAKDKFACGHVSVWNRRRFNGVYSQLIHIITLPMYSFTLPAWYRNGFYQCATTYSHVCLLQNFYNQFSHAYLSYYSNRYIRWAEFY